VTKSLGRGNRAAGRSCKRSGIRRPEPSRAGPPNAPESSKRPRFPASIPLPRHVDEGQFRGFLPSLADTRKSPPNEEPPGRPQHRGRLPAIRQFRQLALRPDPVAQFDQHLIPAQAEHAQLGPSPGEPRPRNTAVTAIVAMIPGPALPSSPVIDQCHGRSGRTGSAAARGQQQQPRPPSSGRIITPGEKPRLRDPEPRLRR